MSDVHGAVGAYVTDALDDKAKAEFEAHLSICDTCTREVREFAETAAELARVTATPPPPELRHQVLQAIKDVRPLPPIESSGAASELEAPIAAPSPGSRSDELAVHRQRRMRRVLTMVAAAVLVVAIALGGWVYALLQQRQAQLTEARLETQLLSAPDVKIYSTRMSNGSEVSFVVSKQLNKGLFVAKDLAAVPPGKTYQLWTIDQAKKAVRDSLVPAGGSRKEWLQGNLAAAAALAVTIEPAGGSDQPTTTPLTVATL